MADRGDYFRLEGEGAEFPMFVYGTLRWGGPRNYLLTSTGAVFLEGCVVAGCRLLDLGAYPALVPSDDPEDRVYGEIWAVTKLTEAVLDRVEGTPWLFDRTLYETDRGVAVQAYTYMRAVDPGVQTGREWDAQAGKMYEPE